MVAEESKMLISISTAMAQMGQRLQKEQQLRQNDFTTLAAKKEDMSKYKGGIRLREMVLKEGKVLPNQVGEKGYTLVCRQCWVLSLGLEFGFSHLSPPTNSHLPPTLTSHQLSPPTTVPTPTQILDVSSFMNSLIDVDLMWDAAEELSARFVTMRPTKILTVATSGLILAIPMGKILQVPVVYARKERSVVMSDTFSVGYSSKTSGSNKELLVDKVLHVVTPTPHHHSATTSPRRHHLANPPPSHHSTTPFLSHSTLQRHIDEDDRVLLVDDFLSSGAAQEVSQSAL